MSAYKVGQKRLGNGRPKRKISRKYSKWEGHVDYAILFLVLFLVGFGLVILYSTSSYKGSLLYNDTTFWLKKQAVFALVGIIVMILISRVDYHWFQRKRWMRPVLYIGTVGILAATFAFGALSHGSRRWLSVGSITFQPSEMAKITLILFLAAYISRHASQMRRIKGLIGPFLLSAVIILIVGVSNLSTAMILAAITFVMIFVSSPLYKPFVGLVIAVVLMAVLLIRLQGYRMVRITTWLDPASSEKGDQTMQGLYAIGSGGLFGKGLGQSMQKLGFLPEANNDMIFSVICEELGLFGAICVLALFFALLWRLMIIALNAPDLYGSMIVVGVIAHIGIQVFINIAVATNTMPNTGVPLPFISYGGSSLFFVLVEMGFVLSVSKYIRVKESR